MPFLIIIYLLLFYPILKLHIPLSDVFWEDLSILVQSEALKSAFLLTIKCSLIAILLLLMLLLATCDWLSKQIKRGKGKALKTILDGLVLFYMTLPPAVLGLMLLIAYGKQSLGQFHLALSTTAVIMVAFLVGLPILYQILMQSLGAIPISYELLCHQMGLNQWQIFYRIHLPLIKRDLLRGIFLAWARMLAEFGATLIFAGNLMGESKTLTLLIYEYIALDIKQAQLLAMMMCDGVLLVFLVFYLVDTLQSTSRSHNIKPKVSNPTFDKSP
jgi:molybdate transport system permease protein